MLFVLRPDIEIDSSSVGALENLLLAFREGKHLVLVGEQLAKSLYSRGDLSARSKGALKKSLSRWAELAGLRQALPFYVDVCSDRTPIGATLVGDQTVIRMPLVHFSDSEQTQKSVLLAENFVDASFYRYVAIAFAATRQWRGLRISLELRGGGGSTLPVEAQQICDDGRLCVIIADSDRRAPSGAIGSTARRLMRITAREFQTLFVLASREIENLVSAKLLNAMHLETSRQMADESLATFLELSRTLPGEWRQFVDMKAGIKMYDLRNMGEKSPEKEFWVSWLPKIAEVLNKKFESCVCESRGACGCILWPGLGEQLLERILDYCGRASAPKQRESIDPDDSEISALCKRIISWGTSMERFVT